MYIVCWQDKSGGKVHKGESGLSLKVAKACVAKGNSEYPALKHWIEPVAK